MFVTLCNDEERKKNDEMIWKMDITEDMEGYHPDPS